MYILCSLWAPDSVTQITHKIRFTLVSDSLKLDSVIRIEFTITTHNRRQFAHRNAECVTEASNVFSLLETSYKHIYLVWFWFIILPG